jgi:sulfatase modifying factor 1
MNDAGRVVPSRAQAREPRPSSPLRAVGRAAVGVGLALLATMVACACSLLVDTSQLASPEDGREAGADGGGQPGDGAMSEGGNDARGDGGCPAGPGPKMINVGTYCIDSTEVTQSQYAAFLVAKAGDTSGQIEQCQWNTTFAVSSACDHPFDPIANPNVPAGGEDWCDARAYCQWAGKHLCGRIGGGATASALGSPAFQDATQSEWFSACSHRNDGLHAYPYGTTYEATACNGDNRATGRAVDAGGYAGCEGGFPGLFDMSGSLNEWEDGCEPGDAGPRSDRCANRGGAFYSNAGGLRCDAVTVARRDYADGDCDLAIRCCADLR